MRLSRLLISGVLLFLISGFSYSQKSKPDESQKPARKTQQAEKYTAQPITIIQQFLPNSPETENENKKAEDAKAFRDWALIAVTGVLALLTFFLFWQTKNLAKSAFQQGDDFKKHSERELLAYITVTGNTTKFRMQQFLIGGPPKPYIFNIRIKNDGKTPAEKLSAKGFIKILENEPCIFDIEKDAGMNHKTYPILNPGSDVNCQFIANDIYEELTCQIAENGIRGHIFLFGKITYFDVFGQGQENLFCFRLNKDGDKGFRWFCIDVNEKTKKQNK